MQACGDAHLSNFGAFAAPDRRLVFDLNDFDETLPGPWEWDVKRLAASFAIAARERGFKRKQARRRRCCAAVAHYREAMRDFAALGNLEVWYARLDVEEAIAELRGARRSRRRARRGCGEGVAKAQAKDSLRALERLTEDVDGEIRFRSEPPLLVARSRSWSPAADGRTIVRDAAKASSTPTASRSRPTRHLLDGYRFREIARKVVGVGSVGTRAWVILLTGRGDARPALPAGEGGRGLGAGALRRRRASTRNHGQRVVEGQRLMQAASDIFLGWCTGGRARRPRTRLLRAPALGLEALGRRRAALRRRARGLRADLRLDPGPRPRPLRRPFAIAAYLGGGDGFDRAICRLRRPPTPSRTCATTQALLDAIDSGRVAAEDALARWRPSAQPVVRLR